MTMDTARSTTLPTPIPTPDFPRFPAFWARVAKTANRANQIRRSDTPRYRVAFGVVAFIVGLVGVGKLVLLVAEPIVNPIFSGLVLAAGVITGLMMMSAQPISHDVMESGGIRTIRIFVTAVVVAITSGVTFIVLGAQLPDGASGGIWGFDEAVAGLAAAVAGTAIAGVGFVFGSTEDRISHATTGFVNSHRKAVNAVRELDQRMEGLWSSFDDVSRDVGLTFLSKLRASSQVVDEGRLRIKIEGAATRLEGVSSEDVIREAAKVARDLEAHASPFEAVDWSKGEGQTLGRLRKDSVGSTLSGRPELNGLFPVDTEFLASEILDEGPHAVLPDHFRSTSIEVAGEIAREFVRRNDTALKRARMLAAALSEQFADVPVRADLLTDDLSLLNLILGPFENDQESGVRLELASIRFLSYAATYAAGAEAGRVLLSDESECQPTGTLLGYWSYAKAITALDRGIHVTPVLRQEHPLYFLSALTGLVASFLGASATTTVDAAVQRAAPSDDEYLIFGLVADITYGRSPLRNWTRVCRAAERRALLASRLENANPVVLLTPKVAASAEGSPHRNTNWPILQVEQRRSPDSAWKELATEIRLGQTTRPDPVRVSTLADLEALRYGNRSSVLVKRLGMAGMK